MNVCIIHDTPLIRSGIAASLTSHGWATETRELDNVNCRDDDAINICDYKSGIALAYRFALVCRAKIKNIIILTDRKTEREVRTALESGVRGYVLQQCNEDELIAAVKSVENGLAHITESMAGRVADSMFRSELSGREIEVLILVAEGFLNKTVANTLGIAEDTVKTHLKTISAKLGVSTRTHAVVVAARRGIIQIE